MTVTVNLMSSKRGEVRRFMNIFFVEELDVDDDVVEWIYVYRNALAAIRVIDIFIENSSGFDVSLWVQINDEDIIQMTKSNRKKITADILREMEGISCF